jgi:hypothetical protein
MELTDARELANILEFWQPERKIVKQSRPQRRWNKPIEPPAYMAPMGKSFNRGCKCGACRSCIEEARWERIFREKFADPAYYSPRPVSLSSPLSEI